ncbi:AlpA family phage regulatory protein [Roseobacter sp. AzwK-3b]|uniref:helix-turn-helix transcriptional regulator n=1 Tax=Roseobacter sp. AzwK-3b TaxID=351016 RepID=UPI0009FD9F16|nr:AlpA family phage regulatory protein [Roseobacter sp. AzwK-3b]
MFIPEVVRFTGYSPQHLRRLEAKGEFPRRIRIGANRIAWLQNEVEEWLNVRVEARHD